MSIINEAKKGNNEAFVTLIEQYKIQMYKTAKAILKNEDDVCDAMQEVLISCYKNIRGLKNEKYFKTWVIRITINKCYDIIEKNSVNNSKIEKNICYLEEEHNNNNIVDKIDLERALKSIDSDLRIVTVLYYYDDIAIKDIAEMLEIPTGTVKSKLSRAREKLYEILKQEEVSKIG